MKSIPVYPFQLPRRRRAFDIPRQISIPRFSLQMYCKGTLHMDRVSLSQRSAASYLDASDVEALTKGAVTSPPPNLLLGYIYIYIVRVDFRICHAIWQGKSVNYSRPRIAMHKYLCKIQ